MLAMFMDTVFSQEGVLEKEEYIFIKLHTKILNCERNHCIYNKLRHWTLPKNNFVPFIVTNCLGQILMLKLTLSWRLKSMQVGNWEYFR